LPPEAFGGFPAAQKLLKTIPGLAVKPIASSCCGMAGAFGYDAAHLAVSKAMGELSLAPAVRAIPAGELVVADGTSCRHQIRDLTGREALHSLRVMDLATA
jgi:Fe-S oxidoreductase